MNRERKVKFLWKQQILSFSAPRRYKAKSIRWPKSQQSNRHTKSCCVQKWKSIKYKTLPKPIRLINIETDGCLLSSLTMWMTHSNSLCVLVCVFDWFNTVGWQTLMFSIILEKRFILSLLRTRYKCKSVPKLVDALFFRWFLVCWENYFWKCTL